MPLPDYWLPYLVPIQNKLFENDPPTPTIDLFFLLRLHQRTYKIFYERVANLGTPPLPPLDEFSNSTTI